MNQVAPTKPVQTVATSVKMSVSCKDLSVEIEILHNEVKYLSEIINVLKSELKAMGHSENLQTDVGSAAAIGSSSFICENCVKCVNCINFEEQIRKALEERHLTIGIQE